MNKIEQEEIHIISRHSNLSKQSVQNLLIKNVYNDKVSWYKFLQILFISLGVSFLVAGLIFFFAYNWDELNKFVKLGLIQFLIILTIGLAYFLKIKENLKNIVLTGAALLVGVLYAVFGQIYQTGANAYDFFLIWTICISIWVIAANFYPLWLIFMLLINTTFILYTDQVSNGWDEITTPFILYCINGSVLIMNILSNYYFKQIKAPNWYTNILAIATVTFATASIITMINFSYFYVSLINNITFLVYLLSFVAGILYGYRTKNIFYLAIIPFAIVIIISSMLVMDTNEGGMFLIASLFITVSITIITMILLKLQKKWKNEKN
ncbi:DUF2157 domain-containing protein [Empedobacter sedimenti]|uniref:DUF2157 domain-containing protein n=1 Tax=Empedobacter sedimenti TaxID=3042610 RepID=UPI0024A73105|nr:DUF2157 domain-containing protein [Empedobacter sedimenti]